MRELRGLDLTPKPVGEPDTKRVGGRLRVLLLVAVLAIASVGVGWITIKYVENLLFPTVDGTRCATLAPGNCLELSLQTAEQVSGLDLPEGSEVVKSGSSSKFAARTLYALIRLPDDSSFTPPLGYESKTGGPPSRTIMNLFDGVGVSSADTGWRKPGKSAWVWVADDGPYLVVWSNR